MTQRSPWRDILTPAEIEDHWQSTARLDRPFAAAARAWWERQTKSQLDAHAEQCWRCNDADGYQLARSYAAQWIAV